MAAKLNSDLREDLEERTAIMEFEAGIDRAMAEYRSNPQSTCHASDIFECFLDQQLFEGKSVNTIHFVFAAFLSEGFLIKNDQNSRHY